MEGRVMLQAVAHLRITQINW